MGLYSRMQHNSDLGFKGNCVISAALESPGGIAQKKEDYFQVGFPVSHWSL